MITPDLSHAAWRKSSRSGTNAACVEVAMVPGIEWRKSTRSGSNMNCVEVAVVPGVASATCDCSAVARAESTAAAWRKSTRSGTNSACVEVAVLPTVVAVRDSKSPAGPALAFTPTTWSTFLTDVRHGAFDLT